MQGSLQLQFLAHAGDATFTLIKMPVIAKKSLNTHSHSLKAWSLPHGKLLQATLHAAFVNKGAVVVPKLGTCCNFVLCIVASVP